MKKLTEKEKEIIALTLAICRKLLLSIAQVSGSIEERLHANHVSYLLSCLEDLGMTQSELDKLTNLFNKNNKYFKMEKINKSLPTKEEIIH